MDQVNKCHFCDEPAIWQVMTSEWECKEALGGWTVRTGSGDSVAQVCEQHLLERLSNKCAYHLVYRLDAVSAPDGIDFSILIERCHKRNLSFYPTKETFLGP